MVKTDRIYLDYNATSPLANNVKRLLASGDFLFANASSQHQSGKDVLKSVNAVISLIYKSFQIDSKEFEILFHSGATEGMNTILNLKKGDAFFYFESDHPAIHAIALHLDSVGVQVQMLGLNTDGSINLDKCIEKIQKTQYSGSSWLNFTYMHNETGIVWPLAWAEIIKNKTGIYVHVDAVQSLGKIENDFLINQNLDAYTYSAHKFGGLKGFGFTLFKKELKIEPLMYGGGQQVGLRSGTLNSHGILSMGAALKELKSKNLFPELNNLKNKISDSLERVTDISLIKNTSCNTICLMHKNLKADILLIHFDLMGLDVSSGSACSSGTISPSKTLMAMGYAELAAHNIRISLGPDNLARQEEILSRIQDVIKKL